MHLARLLEKLKATPELKEDEDSKGYKTTAACLKSVRQAYSLVIPASDQPHASQVESTLKDFIAGRAPTLVADPTKVKRVFDRSLEKEVALGSDMNLTVGRTEEASTTKTAEALSCVCRACLLSLIAGIIVVPDRLLEGVDPALNEHGLLPSGNGEMVMVFYTLTEFFFYETVMLTYAVY